MHAFPLDITYSHLLICLQWNCRVTIPIQLFTDNTGAECVPIHTDHKVEHGRTVICLDHLLVLQRTEHFFCKIKGILISLFKRQAWIISQLFKSNLIFVRQRMMIAEVYVHITLKQFCELQVILCKYLLHRLSVKVIQIKYAQLASIIMYIFNYFTGFGLMHRQLEILQRKFPCKLHERLYCKRVMLHGYTEFVLPLHIINIAVFYHLIQLYHLSGIA